jgi:uncharacterized membrane protein YqhA
MLWGCRVRFLLLSVLVLAGLFLGLVAGFLLLFAMCSGGGCRGFTPRMALLLIGCAASGAFFTFWFVKSQMEKNAPWFVAVMDWSQIKQNRSIIVVSVASVLFFVPAFFLYEKIVFLWLAVLVPACVFGVTVGIDWIRAGKEKPKD